MYGGNGISPIRSRRAKKFSVPLKKSVTPHARHAARTPTFPTARESPRSASQLSSLASLCSSPPRFPHLLANGVRVRVRYGPHSLCDHAGALGRHEYRSAPTYSQKEEARQHQQTDGEQSGESDDQVQADANVDRSGAGSWAINSGGKS